MDLALAAVVQILAQAQISALAQILALDKGLIMVSFLVPGLITTTFLGWEWDREWVWAWARNEEKIGNISAFHISASHGKSIEYLLAPLNKKWRGFLDSPIVFLSF